MKIMKIWLVERKAFDTEGKTLMGRYKYYFSDYDQAHYAYTKINAYMSNDAEPPQSIEFKMVDDWDRDIQNADFKVILNKDNKNEH